MGIFIFKRSAIKANENGRDYLECYLFAKKLSGLNRHPIIKHFKANQEAIRLLLNTSNRKFKYLLHGALNYGLCHFEGEHLRTISLSAEKRLFNLNKKRKRERYQVTANQLKPFVQMAVLENNISQQQYKINKGSTVNNWRGTGEPNHPVLSVRKIASLLHVSISGAYSLTKELTAFGLCLTSNRQRIDSRTYFTGKDGGSHCVIWDKEERCYYRLGASFATISPFFRPVAGVNYVKSGFSYCFDCIA